MNNDEKILAMLEGLTATVAKQGEQLAKQGEQLNRMEERLDEIDARSLKSAALLETEVSQKLNLLFEGHSELNRKMDTLATKEQVDELAADVGVIKTDMP